MGFKRGSFLNFHSLIFIPLIKNILNTIKQLFEVVLFTLTSLHSLFELSSILFIPMKKNSLHKNGYRCINFWSQLHTKSLTVYRDWITHRNCNCSMTLEFCWSDWKLEEPATALVESRFYTDLNHFNGGRQLIESINKISINYNNGSARVWDEGLPFVKLSRAAAVLQFNGSQLRKSSTTGI